MPTPAEQAKQLGLIYGGFAAWIDPNTRKVMARTMDGHLVRTDNEDEQTQGEDLGKIIILNFDDELLYTSDKDAKNKDVERLVRLMKATVRTGFNVVILHARNSEKKVASWLKNHGISAGATLVPYGSSGSEKKYEFVKKKIHAGFTDILYFDSDPKAVHAVESLKAPYNKREIKIDAHQIPKLPRDLKARTSEEPDDDAE